MANLIRREPRALSRGRGEEFAWSWDPFRVMDALLRWDPLREGAGFTVRGAEFVPHFDVKETKDAYVLRADMPGVKEGDLEITVTGNALTVSGKREEERREEGDQYYAAERSYGQFARTFSLPDGADVEGVRADLRDGVLSLHVPKKPEVQPRRITVGKAGGGEGKAKA